MFPICLPVIVCPNGVSMNVLIWSEAWIGGMDNNAKAYVINLKVVW